MTDYRIRFAKTGLVRFISHLDLLRCMERAARRAALPAWYTEGFHPRMRLVFALALPLGTESLCEAMDIRLTEECPPEDIAARLQSVLPEGLTVTSVGLPVHPFKDIARAEYEVLFRGENLPARWEAFAAQPEILTEKRGKKTTRTLDLRPLMDILTAAPAGEDALSLTLTLPAGTEENIGFGVVAEAFAAFTGGGAEAEKIVRTKIFCRDGQLFS